MIVLASGEGLNLCSCTDSWFVKGCCPLYTIVFAQRLWATKAVNHFKSILLVDLQGGNINIWFSIGLGK